MSDPIDSVPTQGTAIAEESQQVHQNINDALKSEGGAPVHVFNPDAPAEEKKEAVLENAASLPEINTTQAQAISSDIGTDKNEITKALKESAEPEPSKPAVEKKKVSKASSIPGAYVDEPLDKNGLPTWYTVGWTGFSNLPNPGDEQAMQEFSKTHTPDQIHDIYTDRGRPSNGEYANDLIAQFINDKYFGEWFHNCGVVFTAIFFTWLLIKVRLGFMSCLIVGAFFATYYRTSIKRTRRNTRDDMQREVSLNKLGLDFESVDWINHFLERFWLIFEPALSAQIIGQVDAVLSENTPAFLDSIRLSSFTLGTKAPRVEGIKVYPKAAPDIVCMDWKLSFIPNDVMDLTAREAEAKVNPKIVLTIRVGKGMIGAGMPILLEDIAFSGQLRIKLKLFNEMPHVKSVDISFLEKPHFDYVLKPVGGETFGFDINNIPGLESFVKDQVHSNLGPMMYAPNVFTIDVAALMAGAVDSESANGVLAVTIYSAGNLKPADMFGTVDSYCAFHVNDIHNPELARTGVVENSSHPKWNETHFILLNNLNDVLCFNVKDRNTNRGDSEIGVANLNLRDIEENDNAIEGLNLVVLRGGRPVGEIKADAHYFPVSKPEKKEDGTVIPAEESNSGVARLFIQDCKDIGKDVKKGLLLGGGDINSYAIVKINGQEKLRTSTFKRSPNPRWNKYLEVFIADKSNANVEIAIMNAVDFGEDIVLGTFSSSMNDMQDQITNEKNDWWNLTNGSGKIHLDLAWKPVPLTGFVAGLTRGAYSHPIGVVRLKLSRANGLKNVEMLTGGKSDPYVRVMSGLQLRGRTEAILDELNPTWDTSVFVPIHSLREDLSLEVMDFNVNQSDKLLGLCELLIKDIATEKKTDDEQSVYEGLASVKRKVELMSRERKKGNRGTLEYEAAFYPTLALAKQADKEDEEEEEEEEETTEEKPLGDIIPDTRFENDLHGEKIHYTDAQKIDLLSYPSGVLSVKIHDATLPSKKKAVAEILLDSVDAQFRTSPVKGTTLQFNESGDAFVREIDLSRLMVRLRDPKEDDKSDESLGYWASSIMEIVKGIQNAPPPDEDSKREDYIQEFKLFGGAGGSIHLSFRYTPVVKFTLDPDDSLENQGNLSVTAVSASGLKAADRSGTSDPYCVFSLDGEKVHKTQTYKKQLSPVFKNENFIVPIAQRRKAKLDVKIYDWDQIGSNELLAEGVIPIADLESYTSKEVDVPLRGGSIKLRLKWEPQVLARKRAGTTLIGSTVGLVSGGTNLAFNTGTRVVGGALDGGTKIVGGAIGGGTKIVGGALGGGTKIVGGVVGGGVGALGRGFNKISGRKSSDMTTTLNDVDMPVSPTQSSVLSAEQGSALTQTKSVSSTGAESTRRSIFEEKGAKKNVDIRVNIVEAKDLKGKDKTSDPYVKVRVGKHSVHKTKHIKKNNNPEWNETFTTPVSGTSVLEFIVRDRNTLSDSDIGTVSFNVGENVDAGKPFDGWLSLSPAGSGQIRVQVDVISS